MTRNTPGPSYPVFDAKTTVLRGDWTLVLPATRGITRGAIKGESRNFIFDAWNVRREPCKVAVPLIDLNEGRHSSAQNCQDTMWTYIERPYQRHVVLTEDEHGCGYTFFFEKPKKRKWHESSKMKFQFSLSYSRSSDSNYIRQLTCRHAKNVFHGEV